MTMVLQKSVKTLSIGSKHRIERLSYLILLRSKFVWVIIFSFQICVIVNFFFLGNFANGWHLTAVIYLHSNQVSQIDIYKVLTTQPGVFSIFLLQCYNLFLANTNDVHLIRWLPFFTSYFVVSVNERTSNLQN